MGHAWFIDFHTHYDAEVEIDPSLSESVRHGVTSIVMGSCSLSAAVGEPADIADIFCRVEGIPRSTMLPLLEDIKDWTTFPEYFEHLDSLPLGPHVSAFVGHSNLRMVRSLDRSVKPTRDEMKRMKGALCDALERTCLSIRRFWILMESLSRPLPPISLDGLSTVHLRILREREQVYWGCPIW